MKIVLIRSTDGQVWVRNKGQLVPAREDLAKKLNDAIGKTSAPLLGEEEDPGGPLSLLGGRSEVDEVRAVADEIRGVYPG